MWRKLRGLQGRPRSDGTESSGWGRFSLKDEKITDFRHTMSTIQHEEGFDSAWIETQLAHVDKNAIREAYNHTQYLDRRKEMMQWYASFISNLSVTSV